MKFLFAFIILAGLGAIAFSAYFYWGRQSVASVWLADSGATIARRFRHRHSWPAGILLGLVAVILLLELISQGFHDFVANFTDRLASVFSSDPLDQGPVSIIFFSLVLAGLVGGMLAGSWRACRRFDKLRCVGIIDLIFHWRF